MTLMRLPANSNGPKDFLYTKNVLINTKQRQLSLERDVWEVLNLLSQKEKIVLDRLFEDINFKKKNEVSIENACRAFALIYLLCDDTSSSKDYFRARNKSFLIRSYLQKARHHA